MDGILSLASDVAMLRGLLCTEKHQYYQQCYSILKAVTEVLVKYNLFDYED